MEKTFSIYDSVGGFCKISFCKKDILPLLPPENYLRVSKSWTAFVAYFVSSIISHLSKFNVFGTAKCVMYFVFLFPDYKLSLSAAERDKNVCKERVQHKEQAYDRSTDSRRCACRPLWPIFRLQYVKYQSLSTIRS